MTVDNFFIRDSQVFAQCSAVVESCCYTERQLPVQVFKPRLTFIGFEEFDCPMSPDIWPTLQSLAWKSGDSSVLLSVLHPDPVYFHKLFGYYNWAIIPATATAEEYGDLLVKEPEGDYLDSITLISEKVVWAARSGAWAIWAERSAEICVFGCADPSVAEGTSWRSLEWVLSEVWEPANIPASRVQALKDNYS